LSLLTTNQKGLIAETEFAVAPAAAATKNNQRRASEGLRITSSRLE